LNGIEDVIARPDLADRSIFLKLEPISDEQRRPESELWRQFELARPAILGALLDSASRGLRAMGSVELSGCREWPISHSGPRLAKRPGGQPGLSFALIRPIARLVDANPVASCVREFMSERSSWTGSAADLLRVSVERTMQPRDGIKWPKTPRALAGHLRRAQTFLRALGIEVSFSREGRFGTRVIRIRKVQEGTVGTVSSVGESQLEGSPQ
jgi:hypothetical protein